MLVQDGQVVPAPATAQQLLVQHRGWSYTSALVEQGFTVVDWSLHVQRLARWERCWWYWAHGIVKLLRLALGKEAM